MVITYQALEYAGAASDSLGSAWRLQLDSMPPHLGYSAGMSFPEDSGRPPYPRVPVMHPVVVGSVMLPGWTGGMIGGWRETRWRDGC